MMQDNRHVLQIRELGLLFGGLSVIESLNINIKAGSRTAIIGPNGAGKTTLFNLLSGVYAPTHGAMLLEGHDITAVPLAYRVHLGIGRTFQNLRLMKHLTVLENVMLGQHHRTGILASAFVPLVSRFNRKSVDEAVHAIKAVGLQGEADRLAEGLSYGMQKRVELARALVTRPKLLLLDEPTAGLNSAERNELIGALRSAVGQDVTLLLVEHDLNFISGLCDYVVVLHFGRKIAEGTLAEVQRHQSVIDAYLGSRDWSAKPPSSARTEGATCAA
jgi:branched-chain amino acid transport system ATP-binding protein